MIKINHLLPFFAMIISMHLHGQSYYFGAKVGPGLAFQRWNDVENNGLLSINGDFFLETIPENSGSSFYGQIGYHTRGSSWRNGGILFSNIRKQNFKFHNAVLEFGAKKILNKEGDFQPFYLIGLRGEYNLGTNLRDYDQYGSPFYPNDIYVQKFVYGVTFGGGFEKSWDEFIASFLEITFSPDVKEQYYQGPIGNYYDPFFGRDLYVNERTIRNYSLEIKIGFKFLRKVIYTN